MRIGDSHRAQLRVGVDGAVVVAEGREQPHGPGADEGARPRRGCRVRTRTRQGARVVEELHTWEYGERSGVVEDLAGHRWELTQTVQDTAPEDWGGRTVAPW